MTDRDDERLAAYLSGDLAPDERASLEDELARDPGLRARVEAIREADRALAELGDVRPREGFSQRLRAAVDEELDRQLGDELAARRARRAPSRGPHWTRLAAAAAAAIVVLGGVGIAVSTLGGRDDTGEAGTANLAEADSADGAGQAAAGPAPVILASDRDYDEQAAQDLLDEEPMRGVTARELGSAEADRLADRFRGAFGLSGPAAGAPAPAEEEAAAEAEAPGQGDADDQDEAAGDGSAGGGDDPVGARTGDGPELPGLTAREAADVRRCLPELLAADERTVIPVYAEVATFEGQPAIVYGLVSDAPRGPASRTEVWVVSRGPDCLPLFFTQGG